MLFRSTGTETVHALSFDNGETWAAPGTWGGPASGAPDTSPRLGGSGALNIRCDKRLPRSWRSRHFSQTEIDSGLAHETIDADGDGYDNWQEYVAGTDPRDSASKLELGLIPETDPGGLRLRFNSAANRTYDVYYTTNLTPIFWMPLSTNLTGTGEEMKIAPQADVDRAFYRLRVHAP